MSCTCKNSESGESTFSCPCDRWEHPLPLQIGAGLSELPRQTAGFPEFRRAMLSALRSKTPLAFWRARKQNDLGVMLLEMWAYVCDGLSFYDQVIAQETYLRTVQRRPSLRRLVALLGYLPRPAVGATVQLAALAEGRQAILLPEGTAFRSGAFEGSPPQVFELDQATTIHPLTNRWRIRPPHPGVVTAPNPTFLLVIPQAELKPDAWLLLLDTGNAAQNQPLQISRAEAMTGKDGAKYTRVVFRSPARLVAGTPLTRLQLLMPTQTVGLWTLPGGPIGSTSSGSFGISSTSLAIQAGGSISLKNAFNRMTLTLDSLNRQIKAGEYILVSRQQEALWYRVEEVTEEIREQSPGSTININGSTFTMPGVNVPVTKLTLNENQGTFISVSSHVAGFAGAQPGECTVHYGMRPAGVIVDEAQTTLASTDPLFLEGRTESPVDHVEPHRFLLSDQNGRGLSLGGRLDFAGSRLLIDQGESWQPDLHLPVEVFGNVLTASRGERVKEEMLGNGDASTANQTFKLKKKPLTYLFSPTAANEQGVQNTLRVYVNGIRWTEVASFYGKQPNDQVYTLRQNDEGDSLVTFGDGQRGQRPATGQGNIVASYRFGAGAASPPAGVLNQIATPVKGLKSVRNPLPAAGGADAETAEGMRAYAPQSALVLGRAVSIQDMEAVALAMPGVQAAQVEWRWHATKQRPVVHVWYLGEAGLESTLSQRLRSLSDPSTPIGVEAAQAVPATFSLDVSLDERYLKTQVMAELNRVLTQPKTGFLSPERLGIGRTLFRSQLFALVLSVEGTASVRSMHWDGALFSQFAVTPGAGHYYSFTPEAIQVSG
jgi:hypothetical protein